MRPSSRIQNRLARLAACVAVTASLLAGDLRAETEDDVFRRGLSAFNTGDFVTALSIWRRLAKQGEPRAETGIGFMYHRGQGVSVDDREAAIWFRRAAEQG